MLLTSDIKEYRKDYYRKHKEYLLEYSKWYYSYQKYLSGKCELKDVRIKPKKKIYGKKKKNNLFKIIKGPILIVFD